MTSISGNRASNLSSSALAKQTSDMETRLADMRAAMAKERAKRETLLSASNSIWKNSSTIRASGKSKEPKQSTVEQKSPPEPELKPTLRPSDKPQQLLISARDVEQPNLNTCGPSLLDGDFDESESHAAFAAAVLEWRSAGRCDSSQPRHSDAGANTEVQTDRRKQTAGKRPASAFGSYFNKLMLTSTASKTAGGVAGAGTGCSPAASDSLEPQPTSKALHTELNAAPEDSQLSDHSDQCQTSMAHDEHSSDAVSDVEGRLSNADQLLGKLEELEMLENAARLKDMEEEDEEEKLLGTSTVQISSQAGFFGLTANTRLPDTILLPDDSDDE